MDSGTPITFPQYVMETMFEPGENRQHLVETVLRNLWNGAQTCAHVFEVQFIDQTGTFEAVWIAMPAEGWENFLRAQAIVQQQAVQDAIERLEGEANREAGNDD